MESQNTKDVLAGYKYAARIIIGVAVVAASFLATMWFILPFLLRRVDWPEIIVMLIAITCLCAVSIGYRVKATKMLEKQKECHHKYIGNFCPQCSKVFEY